MLPPSHSFQQFFERCNSGKTDSTSMTMETHRTGGNMAAEAKSDAPIEEFFIDDKMSSMDELKKMSPATIKEMKVEKMGNGKSRIIVTLKK